MNWQIDKWRFNGARESRKRDMVHWQIKENERNNKNCADVEFHVYNKREREGSERGEVKIRMMMGKRPVWLRYVKKGHQYDKKEKKKLNKMSRGKDRGENGWNAGGKREERGDDGCAALILCPLTKTLISVCVILHCLHCLLILINNIHLHLPPLSHSIPCSLSLSHCSLKNNTDWLRPTWSRSAFTVLCLLLSRTNTCSLSVCQ